MDGAHCVEPAWQDSSHAGEAPPGRGCVVCGRTDWRLRFRKQGYDFVECTGCGMTRLDPVPSTEVLARHYAARSAGGNYDPAKAEERRAGSNGMFAFLTRHAGGPPGRLFDVGCFDGQLLDAALHAGWETWGVELQGPAAESARQRHGERIFIGRMEDCSLPGRGYFDAVTATGLIEHLPDPSRLLAFAAAALKDGGHLLIQTPNAGSMPARLMGRYWPCIAAPEHVFYFSHDNLRRLCERFGFELVTWQPHWKTMRLGYAFDQFQYFGEEIGRVIGKVTPYLPDRLLDAALPLYGGEMLFLARKQTARRATA